jgi:hypothetical protein
VKIRSSIIGVFTTFGSRDGHDGNAAAALASSLQEQFHVRWILISLATVVAASVAFAARSRGRHNRRPEVGAVSDEWINAHRADSPHE